MARFGVLQGVVHAVGAAEGRVLTLAKERHAKAMFAAKVGGTLNLAALLCGEMQEVFALCSPLTAQSGAVRQPAYTAACAFQDAWRQQAAAAGADLDNVI
ncbi:KR domain-containing protein [Azohydromonas aeria]|uniref:KR domain-containing protein n=1 Tax=Azohydromonas aeria TaxID=2590212 RepID=UPI0012FCDD47|nr:KR domain-containing protein [Azohydromonas aeria]